MGGLGRAEQARRAQKVPLVLTIQEVKKVHAGMSGTHDLMGKILYGSRFYKAVF